MIDGQHPDYDGDGDPDTPGPVSCGYPWTVEDHLDKLQRLRDNGRLSQEQYERAREQLTGSSKPD